MFCLGFYFFELFGNFMHYLLDRVELILGLNHNYVLIKLYLLNFFYELRLLLYNLECTFLIK